MAEESDGLDVAKASAGAPGAAAPGGEKGSAKESERDDFFMRAALEEAHAALLRSEVPVGCVIVRSHSSSPSSLHYRETDIIAKGSNRTNVSGNATRHAEFEAIDKVLRLSSCSPCGAAAGFPPSYEETLGAAAKRGGTTRSTETLEKGPGCSVFRDCELFVTVEPCIMCAGALSQLGIKRVVFGAHNERFGGCGSVLSLHERGGGKGIGWGVQEGKEGRGAGNERGDGTEVDVGNCTSGSGSAAPAAASAAAETASTSTPASKGRASEMQEADATRANFYRGFPIRSGVLRDEAVALLRQFYIRGNPAAPKPARKVL